MFWGRKLSRNLIDRDGLLLQLRYVRNAYIPSPKFVSKTPKFAILVHIFVSKLVWFQCGRIEN